MSRQRSDYPGSRWDKFFRWLHGEYDPFAGRLEMKRPEEHQAPPPLDLTAFDLSAAERRATTRTAAGKSGVSASCTSCFRASSA